MALGDKIFRGFAWSAIDRIAIQAIQFIIGIILARILSPREYGILAILIVFIVLSQVFIDSGFTKALVQRKNRTNLDISTVFVFNIAVAIVCYIILWAVAPLIASFYEIEELNILLRVLALTLVINALYAVPYTLFTIELDFRSLTRVNILSVFIGGLIAIYLAATGWGVWALVYQAITRSCITLILILIISKWRPSFRFSNSSFQRLFAFGSKLLVSSLLANLLSNINSLLIGKYISAKDLGFYSRGVQFSDAVYAIFNAAITNVLLPGLAPVQDQKEVLVNHTRIIMRSSALIIVPVFLGLSILAEPIILVLLTEKWSMAIPIMQIFCVARLLTVLAGINVNLLYVIGRSDLVLNQQYIAIAARLILLIIALPFGIIYVAYAELLATMIHFFIYTFHPGRIMNYGAREQIKDISKIVLSGIIMLLPVYGLFLIIDDTILRIVIAPLIAAPTYLGSIYLFKVKEAGLLIEKSKGFIKRDK